jgi:thiamine biosynthesis lipoprotein
VSTVEVSQTGATAAPETWEALGTTAVLRMDTFDRTRRSGARRAMERELEAMDAAASRFRDDSELSRVNRAGGTWAPIGSLVWDAIALAIRAAQVSDGAVDPTLGRALIELGYDRDWRELEAAPDDSAPVSMRRGSAEAWRLVELGDAPSSVRCPPGVMLDLGATAKAMAADRAARAAAKAADAGVLVALGGDIAVRGPAPAAGWRVHVTDDHRSGPDAPGQTVLIGSGGLATSSTSVRNWSRGGQRMHHILDPNDGLPVRSRWRTVSVAAASCAEANIASTAAIVLGDDAIRWLDQHRLPARLVDTNAAVELVGGWPP